MNPRNCRILWDINRHDGASLEGMCLYKNKKCWYKAIHEQYINSDDRHIVYVILELSPVDIEEEETWHTLFEAYVGTHTNYNEKNQYIPGKLQPRDGWKVFYEQYKNKPPRNYLKTNKIIKAFVE